MRAITLLSGTSYTRTRRLAVFGWTPPRSRSYGAATGRAFHQVGCFTGDGDKAMRQADIERGRTYINWPETATRTVTSVRGGMIYFSEVRHDWRPPRDRCRFERFAGWAKREVDQPLPQRRVRPLPKL